jgi:hypothetical protein
VDQDIKDPACPKKMKEIKNPILGKQTSCNISRMFLFNFKLPSVAGVIYPHKDRTKKGNTKYHIKKFTCKGTVRLVVI